MANQVLFSTENNFTRGLITEATGLNFPENAATDSDNCVYTLIGDVTRRLGINKEISGTSNTVSVSSSAINTYKWNNVGGDGLTEIVVEQVGGTLYFYRSSSATVSSPLSVQLLSSTVNLSNFIAFGSIDTSIECQFSSGNGYLFVFHPQCDPFYCNYITGVITGVPISLGIRDFAGIDESIGVNVRPTSLNQEHLYNLTNQGWTAGNPWQSGSTTLIYSNLGSSTFIVATGLTITNGDTVLIENNHQASPGGIFQVAGTVVMTGTVTSYTSISGTLVINVTYVNPTWSGSGYGDWIIVPTNHGYISTWNSAEGNYPSNADVWWYFKNSSGTFDPATTQTQVDLSTGNAPKGSFVLNPFNQKRSAVSGVTGLTDVTTVVRPRTGAWFQGRIFYSGVDDTFAATGDAIYTTWTENIYFSQVIQTSSDFGKCYKTNDPTSEQLFGDLPTDGGVITIQGSGSIFKLFPLQNALLVFAANGVYYITGSQGIGFAANDYNIIQLSHVRSISGMSFVDVNGWPVFWNEEGIYQVSPTQDGQNTPGAVRTNQIQVSPITVGTIQTFYDDIPKSSKKYARGAYDPIEYTLKWVYKDTEAVDVTDRYRFNKVLCYNTYNKAFYPYTIDTTSKYISGVVYVTSPGGLNTPESVIKYSIADSTTISFGDENDDTFVDWGSIDFVSTFTTGYKLRGQGIKKFQPSYIQVYCRTNDSASSYRIQSLWDYSTSRSSGRWSSIQLVTNGLSRFGTVFRRHRLRGSGFAVQFKFLSASGLPFDIQGWAVADSSNSGV